MLGVEKGRLLMTLSIAFVCAGAAGAATVPFTEDFDSGPADWRDNLGGLPAWVPSGGRDGSAYVTASYLVPDQLPTFGEIMFRAQDEFGSSGNNFFGNWIADGVKEFSYWVRHDAPGPLDVFVRLASPVNFPGAVGINFAPVLPGVWTQLVVPISSTSPNIILEGGTYADVFSNIGHVQIGIVKPVEYIGFTITVDLDKVSITPAPGGLALLAFGALGVRRRRRESS